MPLLCCAPCLCIVLKMAFPAEAIAQVTFLMPVNSRPYAASLMPDQNTLAVLTKKEMYRYDLAAETAMSPLPIWGEQMAFSSDGSVIVTRAGVWAHIFDTATGEHLHFWRKKYSLQDIDISSDGRYVATARLLSRREDPDHVCVWDRKTKTFLKLASANTPTTAIAFSPKRNLLAAGDETGTLRVWDVDASRLEVTRRWHSKQITHIEFSPDSTRLLTSVSWENSKIWETKDWSILRVLPGTSGRGYRFTPEGNEKLLSLLTAVCGFGTAKTERERRCQTLVVTTVPGAHFLREWSRWRVKLTIAAATICLLSD